MSERIELERLDRHRSHELFHGFHGHAHPPHNHNYSLSNNHSGGSGGEGLLTLLGTSMAAHPVGWAIGAVAVLGIGAYFLLAED